MVLPIVFSGCSENNDSKAKTLVENQLKGSLHDYDSYESVEFGKLDSTFTTLLDDSLFRKLYSKRLSCQKIRNTLYEEAQIWRTIDNEKYNNLMGRNGIYIDSTAYYYKLELSARENFIPQFNGWSMKHSFRANNAGGNKVITHKAYCFDKDITEITETQDWETFISFDLDSELKKGEKEFLGE